MRTLSSHCRSSHASSKFELLNPPLLPWIQQHGYFKQSLRGFYKPQDPGKVCGFFRYIKKTSLEVDKKHFFFVPPIISCSGKGRKKVNNTKIPAWPHGFGRDSASEICKRSKGLCIAYNTEVSIYYVNNPTEEGPMSMVRPWNIPFCPLGKFFTEPRYCPWNE